MVKIYEFDCHIYPRKLWVAIGSTTEELRSTFLPDTINDMDEDCDAEVSNTGICDKERNVSGVLIRFRSKSVMTPPTIAHESCHAMMEVLSQVGAFPTPDHQEPAAYFIGWIVKCINETKNYKPNK